MSHNLYWDLCRQITIIYIKICRIKTILLWFTINKRFEFFVIKSVLDMYTCYSFEFMNLHYITKLWLRPIRSLWNQWKQTIVYLMYFLILQFTTKKHLLSRSYSHFISDPMQFIYNEYRYVLVSNVEGDYQKAAGSNAHYAHKLKQKNPVWKHRFVICDISLSYTHYVFVDVECESRHHTRSWMQTCHSYNPRAAHQHADTIHRDGFWILKQPNHRICATKRTLLSMRPAVLACTCIQYMNNPYQTHAVCG